MMTMTRSVLTGLATLSFLGLSGAASAQSAFEPPEGCEGTVTVQHKSCLVAHIWQCEADDEGDQWIALFTVRGAFSVKKVDDEFQWLETYYADPPRSELMQPDAPDPASLTELFETGFDSYDFTIDPGNGDPLNRIVGFDQLTGDETVIDGEPLLNTEYGYEELDPEGEVTSRRAGRQYVSLKHRMFLLGESWDRETPDQIFDARPVEFIYPGEAGFFSPIPKYDCPAIDAWFEVGQ